MRSAATSVSVFQWPCGTLATRRSPRGERPRCRTILVVTAVSSMKTRRGASSLDCSTFNSARAAATSGRSCSAACRVFFERDVVAFVEAPDRGRTGFQPLLGLDARRDSRSAQVQEAAENRYDLGLALLRTPRHHVQKKLCTPPNRIVLMSLQRVPS